MADKATETTSITDFFYLKVYSPFKVYYEDNVSSISAVNDTGPFDVLAHHHHFITLLNSCNLVIRTVGKEDTTIIISRGVMQVKTDKVIVFLDV
jgi:F0F1-type ATP synthase epsilon subunit